jgi:hypothetical protein
MYTALEIFVVIMFLTLSAVILSGGFIVVQWTIERFIIITLPVLVDLYGRIRYPYEFKDK